ncbi:MAG: hypothetical protein H0T78_05120 [Longispora sp.]|nr:hypothetical protein [Longispora sp. (in: high G+C Gram-positive bacteria)]
MYSSGPGTIGTGTAGGTLAVTGFDGVFWVIAGAALLIVGLFLLRLTLIGRIEIESP